jgi:hypothetical protein
MTRIGQAAGMCKMRNPWKIWENKRTMCLFGDLGIDERIIIVYILIKAKDLCMK